MSSIPQFVLDELQKHPNYSGADLSRALGLKGRTARRYVENYRNNTYTSNEFYTFVASKQLEVKVEDYKRYEVAPELLKAAVIDIETTSFETAGWAERLICVCILPLGADKAEVHAIRFDDRGNDLRLLKEAVEALNKFTILIGHNCSAFDLNWINSRLMFNHLPPLTTKVIFDTYQIAKSLAIRTSKGLGNLTDYFGLEGEKTRIFRTSWNRVFSAYENEFNEGLSEIVEHCQQDVVANRNVFDCLFPYALSTGINPFKISKFKYMNWSKAVE